MKSGILNPKTYFKFNMDTDYLLCLPPGEPGFPAIWNVTGIQ